MQRSTADKLTFFDAGNPLTVCQAAAAEDHGSQHATPEGVYTVDGQSTATELILANSIPILSLSLSFFLLLAQSGTDIIDHGPGNPIFCTSLIPHHVSVQCHL